MVAQVHEQARRMGALRAVALCRCFSGALHFQNGDWTTAAGELDEAVSLYRQLGGASGESLSLQRLGVLLTARGEIEKAMAVFDEGVFAAERATMRSHCLTRLYASMARNRLAAGDAGGAAESMRQGEEAARRHGHCVTCNALLLPESVRVAVARGDAESARRSAGALDAIARDFGSRAWQAMARQAAARVAAVEERWDAAADAFAEAHDAFVAVGSPYDAARSLMGQVRALRSAGRAADGIESSAQAIFSRIGAAGVED